jgi:TetR/AcrR family transcriptional repressor of nem operon
MLRHDVPRPREFDEDEVLDQVVETFWRRGYEATSVSDLMEATGLAKGSLYKGFGDKHQLYLRALERYLAAGLESFFACARQQPTGRDALEALLLMIAGYSTCAGERRGCFAVNSTIELASHDAEVRNVLRRHNRATEKLFTQLVEQGMEDGSLRAGLDPAVVAGCVTTVIQGLQVRGKLGLTRPQARATVDMALQAWLPE